MTASFKRSLLYLGKDLFCPHSYEYILQFRHAQLPSSASSFKSSSSNETEIDGAQFGAKRKTA